MNARRTVERVDPQARIRLLERQLEAAQREIAALTAQRDIAVRVSVWSWRRPERQRTGDSGREGPK